MSRTAFRNLALAAVLMAALPACTTSGMGPKQGVGTLGGAALGGLAGAQIGSGSGRLVAVGVGTLLGAFVGGEVGASLDRADRLYMQRAEQAAYAAPIGQQIQWRNPGSGNSGMIQPVREGHAYDGSYCREFQQAVYVGGRAQQAYGTACQQRDGSWRIAGR